MSSASGRRTPSRSRSVNAGAEARAGNSGAPDPSSRSGSDVAGDVDGGELGNAKESEFETLGDLSRPGSRASHRSSFKFDGKPGEKLFGMQLLTDSEIGGFVRVLCTPPSSCARSTSTFLVCT